MEFNEAFTQAVLKVVGRLFQPITTGDVKSVDKENNTCVVEVTGLGSIPDVNLISTEDKFSNQVVIYPKEDSTVTIAFLFGSRNNATVIKYGETDGLVLNGEQFGGMGKTEQIAERMKRLEDGLETLQTKFNTHTHVTECGAGAGTAAVTTGVSTVSVTPKTTQAYISNDKVKHG